MNTIARPPRQIVDFLSFRQYRGYCVVVALFVSEFVVTGISVYSFSLYIRAWLADPSLTPAVSHPDFTFSWNPASLLGEIWRFVADLASGWSLTAINFAYTITLPTAFVSLWIGAFIDRTGARRAMLFGVPLVAVSLLLQAFMTEVWQLWLLQFLSAIGQSAAFLGAGLLVGQWFRRNRGLMMGITLAGNNAGGIVMAPVSAALIAAIGWRAMFLLFGAALLVITFVLTYVFVRDRPEEIAAAAARAGRQEEWEAATDAIRARIGRSMSGALPARGVRPVMRSRAAIRTRAFWFMTAAMIAFSVSIFAVLNPLGRHLEIGGITLATSGTALGLLGFFGLVSKVLFGWVAQRLPVRHVFGFCLLLQALGVAILLLVTSPERAWLLLPFVVIYGLGFGALGALQSLIVLDSFGFAAFATILGVMQVLVRLASAVTPTLTGLSVDATGSYDQVFVITIAALLVGALLVALARPPRLEEAAVAPAPTGVVAGDGNTA